MLKKVLSLLLAVLLSFTFISCSDEPPVYSHCELTVPLPENFYEVSDENFDVSYTDGECVVAILRISHDAAVNEGISNLMSTYEFGQFWLLRCERSANLINDGIVYCDYYDGGNYYLEAFYRSKHAYFVVLFATSANKSEMCRSVFIEYANGVKIIEE